MGISTSPIILTPTGGVTAVVSGTVAVSSSVVRHAPMPIQLCGFVPLVDCALDECRSFNGDCYFNPVFGSLNVSTSTYENDLSTFFIFDASLRPTFFIMQKLNETTLVYDDIALIGSTKTTVPYDHTYGTFYNYGYFTSHLNYTGVQINWGYVLTNNGSGKYRLSVKSATRINGKIVPNPYCMVSEPFFLMPFDCNIAKGTAKFEANQSGKIGSCDVDGYVFDLCKIKLYDSIRQKGFFGYEKTSYDEVLLEYQNGLIDRVRDEAIQTFVWSSKPMPKYIHDRFKTYGMMADSLYVSDYNINNSDYAIKKKSIVKSAGYEPTYHRGTRLSYVKTDFKEGVQGVIKSSSCE